MKLIKGGEMTKEKVLNAFKERGLFVDKIRRARLKDGWFVYHNYAFDSGSDWIEDNNENMLGFTIAEALLRKKYSNQ